MDNKRAQEPRILRGLLRFGFAENKAGPLRRMTNYCINGYNHAALLWLPQRKGEPRTDRGDPRIVFKFYRVPGMPLWVKSCVIMEVIYRLMKLPVRGVTVAG